MKRKKYRYEHPDLARHYLRHSPCEGCEFKILCDVPCDAYLSWWDERMAWLKWRLLNALKQHEGSVILSGYPSEMYERELKGWSRTTRKSYNQNADQRTEVLWCNFEVPGLFDLMEQEVGG